MIVISGKTVEENVTEAIARALAIEKERVAPEAKLAEDLKADARDITNIAANLEMRFGQDIPEADFGKFLTVQSVIDYMKQRLSETKSVEEKLAG